MLLIRYCSTTYQITQPALIFVRVLPGMTEPPQGIPRPAPAPSTTEGASTQAWATLPPCIPLRRTTGPES